MDKCYIPLDIIKELGSGNDHYNPSTDKGYSDGMYLGAKLFSVSVNFLLDTGSATNLLASKVYYEIPLERRPPLEPFHHRLMSRGGHEIRHRGCVQIHITIGDRTIPCRFVVANMITNDGIIGMPGLRQVGFTFHLDGPRLTMNNIQIPVYNRKQVSTRSCVTSNIKTFSNVVYKIEKLCSPPKVVHRNSLNHYKLRDAINTSWMDHILPVNPPILTQSSESEASSDKTSEATTDFDTNNECGSEGSNQHPEPSVNDSVSETDDEHDTPPMRDKSSQSYKVSSSLSLGSESQKYGKGCRKWSPPARFRGQV